jgi:hypothetical protein
LACNGAPDINDDSSPIEYSNLFLTEFLVTLLVEESNLYCHQYYILKATNSLPPQGIIGEEIKDLNVMILYRVPKKSYWCMMNSIRHLSFLN